MGEKYRHLIAAFQYLKGAYKKAGEGLFTVPLSCGDKTKGNVSKLKEGKYRSDIRQKSFTLRGMKHWEILPREAVEAPSLKVFKAWLNGALSSLI